MHAELRRQSVVRVLKNEIGIHICSWLTFGSRIRRSKLWFSLLFNAWASNRRRARSTRANVGLSIIDGGARLWSPELGSIVTNIVAWTLLSLRSFSFSYSFYFGIQKKKHNTKKMSTKIVAYPPVFLSFASIERQISGTFFPSSVAFNKWSECAWYTYTSMVRICVYTSMITNDYHIWRARWIATSLTSVIEFLEISFGK